MRKLPLGETGSSTCWFGVLNSCLPLVAEIFGVASDAVSTVEKFKHKMTELINMLPIKIQNVCSGLSVLPATLATNVSLDIRSMSLRLNVS